MTAEPVAPRALYVHGHKGNAWLDDGVIVLQQDGIRRRIPLAAVAEVRNGGRNRPSLEIALRTDEEAGTGRGSSRRRAARPTAVTEHITRVEDICFAVPAHHEDPMPDDYRPQ
ncbi:hypothetical protein ACFWPV_16760 [Streptomyces uncialis]|uniref:hypothetical protein n=1 Tax=Streptomyces uncialis TaxID=1048205 RepID=UPI0036597B24